MKKDFLNYVRSLAIADPKTPSQRALKTATEVGELALAVLPYENMNDEEKEQAREVILDEAVDTVLCGLSVAYGLEFSDQEIDNMMYRKAKKWADNQGSGQRTKFPVPFEIEAYYAVNTSDLEDFLAAAKKCDAEVVVAEGDGVHAVAVADRHFGDNSSAANAAMEIVGALVLGGFNTNGVSIASDLSHPAVPKYATDTMHPKCHFECSLFSYPLRSEFELERLKSVLRDTLGTEVCYEEGIYPDAIGASFILQSAEPGTAIFEQTVDRALGLLNNSGFNTIAGNIRFVVFDGVVHDDISYLVDLGR